MSSLKDEVPTETSEDFGFKFLGQKQILPSFNEKLPFASLQNLDISNRYSLFIAASGNKVVVGDLQLLRDHITSDSTPLTFKWEKEIPGVIFVCFCDDQALVATESTLYSIDLDAFSEFQTAFSFESPASQLKYINNTLMILNSNNDLTALDLGTKSTNQLVQNVSSFDVAGTQLIVLQKDRRFQSFMWRNGTLGKKFEFSIPSELEEFSIEEYAPLNITILSPQIFFAVFGNTVAETDEEVSYDQKMFIIKYMDGNALFQETFDITPPFGEIVRFPYVYKVTLSGLIKPAVNVNILASSCSSEVSIWDSEEVIEPSQDAERAVLPISEETDRDTNPIGVAVDIATLGTISEPCSGVDTIEKLPLIYILNNEGSLQIVGLFHVAAIKGGYYSINIDSLENERSRSPAPEKITVVEQGKEEEKKEQEKEKDIQLNNSSPDNPFVSTNTSGFSFLKKQPTTVSNLQSQSSSAFGAPSFGSLPFSFDSSSTPSVKSGTAPTNQNTTGASFAKPVFGKPAFGTVSKETSTSGSAFGKPAFGTVSKETSTSGSAFGKPSFGTPSFGSGISADQPSSSGSAFGKPSFGKPSFGTPSFGNPSSDSEKVFAEPSTPSSAFGKPSFGTSAFGTASSDTTDSGSVFGKPAFGSSPLVSSSTDPKPAFSSLNQASPTSPLPSSDDESEDELKSDTHPFSTPFDAKFNASDKSNINSGGFGSSSFGSNFSKALNSIDSDTPFKFGTQASPFSSQLGNESPFSSFKKENIKSESLDNGSPSEVNDSDQHENNSSGLSGNDLTDSTVEQTPSTRLTEISSDVNSEAIEEEIPKSSIGKLTETIKKSANIDMNSLKNPVFGNQVKAKSESPFSAFATNISKPSSTTPAFSFGNSTINNSKTFTTLPSSEVVSSPSTEEKANKETSKKDSTTFKSEENPFLPRREENSKKNSQEHSSQETEDTSFVTGGEKSDAASQQIFDIAKQDQTLAAEDVNIDERSKMESEDNQHVEVDNHNEPTEIKETLTNDKEIEQRRQEVQRNEVSLERGGEKEGSWPDMAGKEIEDDHSVEEIASQHNSEIKGSDDDMLLNSDRDESISESYDRLEDINTDELPHSGENDAETSADFDVQTSIEENYAESGVQTDLSESCQENEVQTDAIPVRHHYTQTVEKEAVNSGFQTDPVETCNFSVQAFEDDENYLAEQCKPEKLKEYYTGAKVSAIPFVSQNSTLRLIESTFQMVEAEFTVLKENIQSMDSFFTDQSNVPLETRTLRSVNNIYTWRIPEAKTLLNFQKDIKSEHTQETNSRVQDLKEKVSNYIKKDITKMSENIINIKEEYLFLTHLNGASSEYVKDLSTHQFRMQKSLRRKLSNVSAKINHTEELLNILKLFSVKYKRLDENPLVTKLAKESLARDGLLQEIKLLREEVSKLQLEEKDKKTSSLTPSSSLTKDMKGFKIVEVGLAMNTKKQIGDFFKNLNLAK
ncbi:hypothetical protein SMKI_09G0580 [Saccharomyces mikatae IFO 1815]|uniref:Nucleoporin Nup159/Nup146 N-terminal domain-containing protein n=1 Tax=Saccharomyces mikatae IFO 1815 TaxID=226126 RepID=A0AA35J1B6_SACMI|nr:uncharacterized protein SMKI_09G0580 [Saccharomyces mikatae IFO 1815]CAI4039651.1 hypothetical protein SMKI_09G0580 [Saccharomyces mikatae IFO 1815]